MHPPIYWIVSTENSIAAMLSRLPCLGGIAKVQHANDAPVSDFDVMPARQRLEEHNQGTGAFPSVCAIAACWLAWCDRGVGPDFTDQLVGHSSKHTTR